MWINRRITNVFGTAMITNLSQILSFSSPKQTMPYAQLNKCFILYSRKNNIKTNFTNKLLKIELNNANNDSDWLKQMKMQMNTAIKPTSKTKSYPIINCGCKNPEITMTNDGNRTQKCRNCGYFVCYD